ncbi:hypothetical protein EW026_g5165 [Hermanssonia centrifuga]|uniref:Uncharacterized protein n=1 Tax=Hermanssonia centrifuga TaxID=98765 RepID=A0A4S4KEY9_9APHY|nr:hypothetical protein EW026_g5165 [Hermanssonia centrifuga]
MFLPSTHSFPFKMSSQLEKHIYATEERNTPSDAWHNTIFSYIQLSRLHLFPLGTIFVFWPFAWGILIASTNRESHPQPIPSIAVATFAFGGIATLLHSAACILSDICDKDFDSQVGFAINFGIFAAWANSATDDSFHVMLPAFVTFAALICWSIFYDTIYAWQDRVDDAKAGVKSTALLFGNHVRPVLSVFAVTFVSLMLLAGTINGNSAWYFFISCGGAACHLIWQLVTWDNADNADCAAKFASNGNLGLIVWVGLVADYMMRLRALY